MLFRSAQRALQERIIALCESTLRANAIESDRKLLFPRRNFEAMAELGLLGLVVLLPVVAHATWHAYRDIVQFPPDEDSDVTDAG